MAYFVGILAETEKTVGDDFTRFGYAFPREFNLSENETLQCVDKIPMSKIGNAAVLVDVNFIIHRQRTDPTWAKTDVDENLLKCFLIVGNTGPLIFLYTDYCSTGAPDKMGRWSPIMYLGF